MLQYREMDTDILLVSLSSACYSSLTMFNHIRMGHQVEKYQTKITNNLTLLQGVVSIYDMHTTCDMQTVQLLSISMTYLCSQTDVYF